MIDESLWVIASINMVGAFVKVAHEQSQRLNSSLRYLTLKFQGDVTKGCFYARVMRNRTYDDLVKNASSDTVNIIARITVGNLADVIGAFLKVAWEQVSKAKR